MIVMPPILCSTPHLDPTRRALWSIHWMDRVLIILGVLAIGLLVG